VYLIQLFDQIGQQPMLMIHQNRQKVVKTHMVDITTVIIKIILVLTSTTITQIVVIAMISRRRHHHRPLALVVSSTKISLHIANIIKIDRAAVTTTNITIPAPIPAVIRQKALVKKTSERCQVEAVQRTHHTIGHT
jgi:hypothetical protein